MTTMFEYQEATSKTAAEYDTVWERRAILGLGLAGEAGETADLVKKFLGHGHAIDRVRLCSELGDVLWYVSELADAFDISLEDIAQANIRKLRARYPEGFSAKASINRGDK